MLSIWNNFDCNAEKTSDDQNPVFHPSDDLWLKLADAATEEEQTGTLAFSQDVLGHFLEATEQSDADG